MYKEQLRLTGSLRVELNGDVVLRVPNLIVTTGKELVANRLHGNTAAVMSHMAIGTSSTAATLADTAAGAEIARVSLASASVSGSVVTYTAQFPAGTPSTASAITEASLLNNSTGGTMLCRTVFPEVNKSASDSMTIIWTVQVN